MAANTDLAAAVHNTAESIDPGDSTELAQAKQLLAMAAGFIHDNNTEDACRALMAAHALIDGEANDGDPGDTQWQPLLDQLNTLMKQIMSMNASATMDQAIRGRAQKMAGGMTMNAGPAA